jgi:hypothetical protein
MRSPARVWRRGWNDPLVHAHIESCLEWREECDHLHGAYRRWAVAAALDRDLAFHAYRAALDREEKAALVVQQRMAEEVRGRARR